MANRAILYIDNATSWALQPVYPPPLGDPNTPAESSKIYLSRFMDSWWFSNVASRSYASFEIRFQSRADEEEDKGLFLFQLAEVPSNRLDPSGFYAQINQNWNAFVLNALSDRSRRHFLRLQSQGKLPGVPGGQAQGGGGTLQDQNPLVIAISRGSAAHAVPDPTDLKWYPLTSLGKNVGIPFGSGTSCLLPAASDPPPDADYDAQTADAPDGYPNGYITEDGIVFGLALVDPSLLLPSNWGDYVSAINNYNLSYVQSQQLQQALKTFIFGPPSAGR